MLKLVIIYLTTFLRIKKNCHKHVASISAKIISTLLELFLSVVQLKLPEGRWNFDTALRETDTTLISTFFNPPPSPTSYNAVRLWGSNLTKIFSRIVKELLKTKKLKPSPPGALRDIWTAPKVLMTCQGRSSKVRE